MIFENVVLFLRDGLLLREFSDAIKSGDSGRVLLVLKLWAFSFRGSGHTKYAYEVLHLVHNITLCKKESQVKSEKTAFSQEKSTKCQYFLTFP